MSTTYLVGDIARLHQIPAWQVRRTILRGFLDEPGRIGGATGVFRVFHESDLPRVEEALYRAGYLKRPEAVHA